MEEIWKPIPEFPKYIVSNLGNVQRVWKTKQCPIKVHVEGNYRFVSLSYAPYKNKQLSLKNIMDQCFEDHIYKDHSVDDLEGEMWKDVIDWEDSYEVSNLGRIRTKFRMVNGKAGPNSVPVYPKIKESYIDEDGYCRISLYEDGRTELRGVHQIVARAFLPNPDNLPQVNHLSGIKTDNRAENLEWATGTSNIQHSIAVGLRDPHVYKRPVTCIDTNEQFDSVASLHRAIGGSYNEIVYILNSNDPAYIYGRYYKYS